MATRWGLLGAGKITNDFAACLNALPKEEHQIVAIASSRLDGAKRFAKDHGIGKFYGSYLELAKDPEIEVAYVGLVNSQHVDAVKLLLEHGKHVVCEKPLTTNAADARKLVAIARNAKLFFMEAVWSRCFPVYERLRKELAAGNLGKVNQVNVTFCKDIQSIYRLNAKELGGGVTGDIGIYALQFASLVFGGRRPTKIAATGFTNAEGVDMAATVGLIYGDDQMACLNYSAKHSTTNDAVIMGTKGDAKVLDPFWASTTLVLPTGETFSEKLPKVTAPLNFGNSAGLAYEAQEVRRCLKAGLLECPHMTLDETVLLAEIMDEIRKQIGVKI